MGEETDIAEPMSSDDAVASEQATAHEPSKEKIRKRKNSLYKSIRQLMEFYLGDANVNKNRFIYDFIQGMPFVYVDLSLFLTFNKLKQLTSRVEDIAKAITSSEILQLSEDKTQVCRKTPIMKKENEDECTIYVEQIGPDIDHDSITKVFSEFGPVDYVSVPKFSSNNKNKGFAFVEFKDAESAKKALETFNARGSCLSPHMAPEELLSIKNFDPNKENKKNENAPKTQLGRGTSFNEDKVCTKREKKRKHSEGEEQFVCNKKIKIKECEVDGTSSECDQIPDDKKSCKKNKESDKTKEDTQGKKTSTEQNKSKKRKKSQDFDTKKESDEKEFSEPFPKKLKRDSEAEDLNSENSGKEDGTEVSQPEDNLGAGETAKQKKRKKRKKVKKDNKSSANSQGFKILSKKDWKHLRNKYLNMQKNTMRSLKQHLSYSSKWEKTRQAPMEQEKEEKPVSGTIIKVTLDEPVTNVNATKLDMRINPEIRYVDATQNSPYVYLRTSTPEFSNTILQAKHWPNMDILKDEEESQYWMKIKADREQKNENKKNKSNQRGRTKLLKKAERLTLSK